VGRPTTAIGLGTTVTGGLPLPQPRIAMGTAIARAALNQTVAPRLRLVPVLEIVLIDSFS
jgi:hypothetical protein